MQPYQQRVMEEKRDLDEKLDRLDQFLLTDNFTQLHFAEQDRLARQAAVMADYSAILAERIAAFKP